MFGDQYEDDANSRSLDAFVTLDLFIARHLWRGLEVFAAAENLFDEEIQNGRSAFACRGSFLVDSRADSGT